MSFQCLPAILIFRVGFIGQFVSAPQSFTLMPKHSSHRIVLDFHGD